MEKWVYLVGVMEKDNMLKVGGRRCSNIWPWPVLSETSHGRSRLPWPRTDTSSRDFKEKVNKDWCKGALSHEARGEGAGKEV